MIIMQADIIGHARKNIVLIDGYIDVVTLNILAMKMLLIGLNGVS